MILIRKYQTSTAIIRNTDISCNYLHQLQSACKQLKPLGSKSDESKQQDVLEANIPQTVFSCRGQDGLVQVPGAVSGFRRSDPATQLHVHNVSNGMVASNNNRKVEGVCRKSVLCRMGVIRNTSMIVLK